MYILELLNSSSYSYLLYLLLCMMTFVTSSALIPESLHVCAGAINSLYSSYMLTQPHSEISQPSILLYSYL